MAKKRAKASFNMEECLQFLSILKSYGYSKRPISEIIAWVERHGGDAGYLKKKQKEGIETLYDSRDETSGRVATVCTSYSEKLRNLKKHDSGWVLIIDPRITDPFFFIPMRRTKNFFGAMLGQAKVALEMLNSWPKCPSCGTDLVIVRDDAEVLRTKDSIHMRWFVCPNNPTHKNVQVNFRVVDLGLTEHASKTLQRPFDRNRKSRNAYFAKHGYYPRSQRLIRYLSKQGKSLPKRSDYTDMQYEGKYPEYADRHPE